MNNRRMRFSEKIMTAATIFMCINMVAMVYITMHYVSNDGTREQPANTPQVQYNYQTIDEDKIERNDALVDAINSQPRLILQSVKGTKTVSCHRWDESQKFRNLFARSDIEIDCQYDVAFVLDPEGFHAYNIDGRVYIEYDTKFISIEYVEFKEIETRTTKSIFGTAYTPGDTVAMLEDAKNSLREELNTKENIEKCEENFRAYIDSIADDCGINNHIVFHTL